MGNGSDGVEEMIKGNHGELMRRQSPTMSSVAALTLWSLTDMARAGEGRRKRSDAKVAYTILLESWDIFQ